MKNKKNKGFASPLYLACSNNGLRPTQQCVHFANGYAYATDGHIAIKQSLTYSDIVDVEKLNGRALSAQIFKAIWSGKYQHIKAGDDGVICTTIQGDVVSYNYAPKELKRPNLEEAVSGRNIAPVEKIGVRLQNITVAEKAAVHEKDEQAHIIYYGPNAAFEVIFPSKPEQIVYIMPVSI